MSCARPSRRCSPIPFRLHTSQLWLWLRFSLKTQPWTLFQGAYRAVFITAGNNYLKQLKPPFRQINLLQYQHGRIDGRQKHNSTENPEISVLLAYNMQLFTEKWKRRKSCSQKAGEKPRNQKKSNKNRIRNIKIIASKSEKKTQNRKIYDFFCPDPVIITVFPKS